LLGQKSVKLLNVQFFHYILQERLMSKQIRGAIFVLGDNIDTDQIIPAEYLTLVPSEPEEYEKLGSYALAGLPNHYGKFVAAGQMKTAYPIIVAGENFGCGSSREHAPIALGASGVKAVVAESYARIFFRNCAATGELYPIESIQRLCEEFITGQEVTIDLETNQLINHTLGKTYSLKPLGEVGPVIEAGGIFAYARQTGMIESRS
jgi:3-isopropylmalate/(R)-2-methylmalate dehydratase small subunit